MENELELMNKAMDIMQSTAIRSKNSVVGAVSNTSTAASIDADPIDELKRVQLQLRRSEQMIDVLINQANDRSNENARLEEEIIMLKREISIAKSESWQEIQSLRNHSLGLSRYKTGVDEAMTICLHDDFSGTSVKLKALKEWLNGFDSEDPMAMGARAIISFYEAALTHLEKQRNLQR